MYKQSLWGTRLPTFLHATITPMRKIAPLLTILLLPYTVYRSVQISEIAWMGTANSANDEWIVPQK